MPTRKSLLGLVLWSAGIAALLATGCGTEPTPTALPTAAPTSIASPAPTSDLTPDATLMPTTPNATSTPAPTSPPAPTNIGADRLTVVGVESLGTVTFETGFMFADTEVGGLSGLTYDSNREVYYALSDDRSRTNPARYYEVDIDIADNELEEGDVTFLAVTTLLDQSGSPFASRSVDPEGIALVPEGILYISSEGDADTTPPINPFVNGFDLNGQQAQALLVPDKFLPDGEEAFGVRDNLAFESLAITRDQKFLYAASESALAQDGPISDLDQESRSRILRYSLDQLNPAQPLEEFVYVTGAVPAPPEPLDAFNDNGLVELVALDDSGTLLALERSFAAGVGNTIRLYEVITLGATDVSGIDDLYDEGTDVSVDFNPVGKRLIVDFADIDLTPDNVEGMTLGPTLPDGRRTLILVSDNNFNADQVTQFIVLALELETASGDTGRILERGLIDCFEAGLETPEGEFVNCEMSAVAYDGSNLILASDKPIPGENRSSVFAIKYDENGLGFEDEARRYLTPSPIANAIKYEDLSITPDGKHIIASTAFDRVKDDSAEWDNYNNLLIWPVSNPDAVKVAAASTRDAVTSSVSLREKFSSVLKTSEFPEGVPYFLIDGVAVIPGNKLLFGIRSMGATFRDFDHVVKIVGVSYEIVDDALMLGDDFELVYDYDPSGRPELLQTIALSSIEFDKYGNRLYLLTSFEIPDADDEGLGGYLWTLPISDLESNAAPTLVLKADGDPLLFAHKAEGIAVSGQDRVFVVHDDDRVLGREIVENPETQFSRERHQGAYTVVEIN